MDHDAGFRCECERPSAPDGGGENPRGPQGAEGRGGEGPKARDGRIGPGGEQEPSGRYWLGRDEEGRPKVCFDDPEAEGPKRAADGPKRPEDAPEAEEPNQADQGAKGPEGKKDKDEVWECDTDKVDREIEKLKKKQQELEQRLNTETDEAKIKDLERQLAQVNRELSRSARPGERRQTKRRH